MKIDMLIDVITILSIIVLLGLAIRNSRSLIGSFFKSYYKWIVTGLSVIVIGFTIERIAKSYGVSLYASEIIHHGSIIVGSIFLVYASSILPKEAASYMKDKNI